MTTAWVLGSKLASEQTHRTKHTGEEHRGSQNLVFSGSHQRRGCGIWRRSCHPCPSRALIIEEPSGGDSITSLGSSFQWWIALSAKKNSSLRQKLSQCSLYPLPPVFLIMAKRYSHLIHPRSKKAKYAPITWKKWYVVGKRTKSNNSKVCGSILIYTSLIVFSPKYLSVAIIGFIGYNSWVTIMFPWRKQ